VHELHLVEHNIELAIQSRHGVTSKFQHTVKGGKTAVLLQRLSSNCWAAKRFDNFSGISWDISSPAK